MNALLISDLHLTDNPRDEYRWALFPWLVEIMPKHGVKDLYILGDLTESKDRHTSRLVNRIVDNLLKLYRQGNLLKIYVLRGNHDGLDPTCPYFRFLQHVPSIQYVATPYLFPPTTDRQVLMLPHTTEPETAWKDVGMRDADFVFMHATVKGSRGENEFELPGVSLDLLKEAKRAKIFSGDVHVPQVVGPVEYVGAPYPVRFGDAFKGRVVLLKNYRVPESLPFPSIQRLVITLDPSDDSMTIRGGDDAHSKDQVKFRVRLAPSDYLDWGKLKDQVVELCKDVGLELHGLELEKVAVKRPRIGQSKLVAQSKSPDEIFLAYCSGASVGEDVAMTGASLLLDAHNETSQN